MDRATWINNTDHLTWINKCESYDVDHTVWTKGDKQYARSVATHKTIRDNTVIDCVFAVSATNSAVSAKSD